MSIKEATPSAGANAGGHREEGRGHIGAFNSSEYESLDGTNITHLQNEVSEEVRVNPLLQDALKCASQGVPVFPCRENTTREGKVKAPYTTRGHHDATTKEAQIIAWWIQWPEAMIGVVPGGNVFVLDIDKHGADGVNELRKWEEEHGSLPNTLVAKTPTGGMHLYFRSPDDLSVPTTNDPSIGIDSRGAGSGYVIAPPSIRYDLTPKGKYQWHDGNVPIAIAPQWLVDKLRAKHGGLTSVRDEVDFSDVAMTDEEKGILKQLNDKPSWLDILTSSRFKHQQHDDPKMIGAYNSKAEFAVIKEIARCIDTPQSVLNIAAHCPVIMAMFESHGRKRILKRLANHTISRALAEVKSELQGQNLAKACRTSIKLVSAKALSEKLTPELEYIVPNIAPVGLTVFAGPSEVGQSYFMIHMAVTKAMGQPLLGKFEQEAGPVLYLSLEAGEAVTKNSMSELHPGVNPENLHFAWEWDRIGEGGLKAIAAVVKQYGFKLVMVDVWTRIEPFDTPKGLNAYQAAYVKIKPLRDLAAEMGFALFVATHYSKGVTAAQAAFDSTQKVTGGLGLPAAADMRVFMEPDPQSDTILLSSGGRAIGRREQWRLKSLRPEGKYGWAMLEGDALPRAAGIRQQRILDILRNHGGQMTPTDIKIVLDPFLGVLSKNACPEDKLNAWVALDNRVQQDLRGLLKQNLIYKPCTGLYAARLYGPSGDGDIPQNFAELLKNQKTKNDKKS